MDKQKTSGERLRIAREKAGWTITEAAAAIETERTTYSSWEKKPGRLSWRKRLHREAIAILAANWEIESNEVWGDEPTKVSSVVGERRAPYPKERKRLGENLAQLLIEIIESPKSTEDQKRTAKVAILDALRDS